LRHHDEIKFVVTSREDFLWSVEIIKRYSLPQRRVLLSPAYGKVQPQELVRWMLEEHLEARLNLQLHKIIFGDRRGV
ncbi:MAG: 7-carboxy-7-deazaguanine synthase QueE, partial [Nitrospirae bacterium]